MDAAEHLSFAAAASRFARDTIDGKVFFFTCAFDTDDTAPLFNGQLQDEDDYVFCRAEPAAKVTFGEHQVTIRTEATLDSEDDVPALNILVQCASLPIGAAPFGMCCSCLLQPEVRMHASNGIIWDDHKLDDASHLRKAMQQSQPLPMLLGVWYRCENRCEDFVLQHAPG